MFFVIVYCYMENLITQDPNILNGKPIIVGTRMSVESVLELLSAGMETNEIVEEYPFLTKKHVEAAIKYATNLVKKEESYIFDKTRPKHA
jgi:uncharacterized protein (DUF433 family)